MNRLFYKFLFISIGVFGFNNSMAQVEMFDESIQVKEEPKVLPYDSLTNMRTLRYGTKDKFSFTFDHLVGQTLLYLGDPYVTGRNRGGFKIGSYYKVVGTLPEDVGKGLYGRMILEDTLTHHKKEEGDLSCDKFNYQWLVVGHYEKMKALYVNKYFVYVGTKDVYLQYEWKKANQLINFKTDTVTKNIKEGTVWKCVGVQAKARKRSDDMDIDKRSPIVLIFDNSQYGKHYCYLEDNTGKPYHSFLDEKKPLVCGRFLLKSYYDNITKIAATDKARRKAVLTKKYGAANAVLILEGKVRLGMTKKMCEEAWGHPYSKNKSIGSWGIHEQWIYGNSYLYFEGDKLTSIQN